jgi:hypothetical protein
VTENIERKVKLTHYQIWASRAIFIVYKRAGGPFSEGFDTDHYSVTGNFYYALGINII